MNFVLDRVKKTRMSRPYNRPKLFLSIAGCIKAGTSGGRMRLHSLKAKIHGGYSWRFSNRYGRYTWFVNPTSFDSIRDRESIRIYEEQGDLECLRRQNEPRYEELLNWREDLRRQRIEYKNNTSVANEINRKLQEIDNWLAAFTRWFLRNGFNMPNIHKDKEESVKSKSFEIKIAPLKYSEKHFKEVDKLVQKGYKQTDALDEVCGKYKFTSREGFGKQYRKMWLDKRLTPAGRTKA